MVPSAVIAPMPVMAPVASMSQSLELTATVAELLPSVVTPVEERVVKAPLEAEEAPMAVPSMAPPLMSTVVAVRVPESVSSDKAMPASRRLNSLPEMSTPALSMRVVNPPPASTILMAAPITSSRSELSMTSEASRASVEARLSR